MMMRKTQILRNDRYFNSALLAHKGIKIICVAKKKYRILSILFIISYSCTC
jgi:hypothetical protein